MIKARDVSLNCKIEHVITMWWGHKRAYVWVGLSDRQTGFGAYECCRKSCSLKASEHKQVLERLFLCPSMCFAVIPHGSVSNVERLEFTDSSMIFMMASWFHMYCTFFRNVLCFHHHFGGAQSQTNVCGQRKLYFWWFLHCSVVGSVSSWLISTL